MKNDRINSSIQEHIKEVERKIEEACARGNRNREDITLIAVSKTKPLEDLIEAYEAGCRDFGENKVQEILEKAPKMPPDARFHMIGHLQRNKVKYIVDKVRMIHSVDSLRLAQQISSEAVKKGVDVDILIEVNVAEEASKFGLSTEAVIQLAEDISKLPAVHIRGLMTVAPFTENPEDNRPYFRNLRRTKEKAFGYGFIKD